MDDSFLYTFYTECKATYESYTAMLSSRLSKLTYGLKSSNFFHFFVRCSTHVVYLILCAYYLSVLRPLDYLNVIYITFELKLKGTERFKWVEILSHTIQFQNFESTKLSRLNILILVLWKYLVANTRKSSFVDNISHLCK